MTFTVRKAHIKRIHGKSGSKDTLPADLEDDMDVWLDIWRPDEIEVFQQDQRYIYRLKWLDKPEDELDPVVSETRRVTVKKVVSPDEDPKDPSTWVPVELVDSLIFADSAEFVRYWFKNKPYDPSDVPAEPNDPKAIRRDVTIMKVTHWDTQPSEEKQWVDQLDYERLEDTEDEAQYVYVEVPRRIATNETLADGQYDGQFAKYRKRDESFLEWMKPLAEDEVVDRTRLVKLDPWQQIVNCQFKPIFAQDIWVLGYGGDGPSYKVLGVRDRKFVVVSSGTHFGNGYIAGFGGGANLQSTGERLWLRDTTTTGKASVGSEVWYNSYVAIDSYGTRSATDPDQVVLEDPRVVEVDLTGGKEIAFWNARTTKLDGAYSSGVAPNGDFLDFGVSTAELWNNRPTPRMIKSVTINVATPPANSALEIGPDAAPVLLKGQRHLAGLVMGKGGSEWFWVIQDFSDPFGLGKTYLDVGLNPDPNPEYPYTLFTFKNKIDAYLRVFDKEFNELEQIPWGVSGGHSQKIIDSGLPFVNRYRVVIDTPEVFMFPSEFLAVLAPIKTTTP